MDPKKELPTDSKRKAPTKQNLQRPRLVNQQPLSAQAKERWLLTRKTWRYMTDTVGNFLPVEYKQPQSLPTALIQSGQSTSSQSQSEERSESSSKSDGRSTQSIGTQSSPAAVQQFQSVAENSFRSACDNQKEYLIWTRTRPTPLSGPALQEQRNARAAALQHQFSSQTPRTSDLNDTSRDPSTSKTEFDEEDDEIWMERDEYDEYDDDDEVITVRERKASLDRRVSSSAVGEGESGSTDISEPCTYEASGYPDTDKVFVSVGVQTEGFNDPPFPPYTFQHLHFPEGTINPGYGTLPYYFTTRRVSYDSSAGGGGTTTSSDPTDPSTSRFDAFRSNLPEDFVANLSYPSATSSESAARIPHQHPAQERNQGLKSKKLESQSSSSSDIPKYPSIIPESTSHSLLVPSKSQILNHPGKEAIIGRESTLRDPSPRRGETSLRDPSQREPSLRELSSRDSSSLQECSQREASLVSIGAVPSSTLSSEGALTTSASSSGTTSAGVVGATSVCETDKKSEESGYSSSISDTVMRYLRMVRKNSKVDKSDIDRFKTVNYDRSLRNIKSKNVTLEEALEFDRNKQAAAAAAAASGGTVPSQSSAANEFSAHIANKQLEKLQEEYCNRLGIPSCSAPVTKAPAPAPIRLPQRIVKEPAKPNQGPLPPGAPPPKRILPSVGIQAGESIIKFLKLFNRRKTSDLSSPSYPSSESAVDTITTASPRSSLTTTVVSSSGSDPDLYPIFFSSREMSAAFSPRASFDTVIYDENQEFDEVFTPSSSTSPPVLHQSFQPSFQGTSKSNQQQQPSPSLSVTSIFPSFRLSSRKGSVPDASLQPSPTFTPSGSGGIKHKSGSQKSSMALPSIAKNLRRSSNSYTNVQDARQSARVNPALQTSHPPKSKSDDIPSLYARHGVPSGNLAQIPVTTSASQPSIRSDPPSTFPRSFTTTSGAGGDSYSSPGPPTPDHQHPQQYSQQLTTSPRKSQSSHTIQRPDTNKPRKGSLGAGQIHQTIMKRLFSSQSKKSDTEKDSSNSSGTSPPSYYESASFSTKDSQSGADASRSTCYSQQKSDDTFTSVNRLLSQSVSVEQDKNTERYFPRSLDPDTTKTEKARPFSRSTGGSSSSSYQQPNPNDSISVMQKSKSSSSVLHQQSSSSSDKSYSSTHRSKSKLFNKHKKHQEKEVIIPKPSNWAPEGEPGVWTSLLSGRQVNLEPTRVQQLSETERIALQKLSLQKLQTLNLGVEVKVPREKTNIGSSGAKVKRRPYLLKKKALSTGFFDSKREDFPKEGSSGLVFSISLSDCVKNDRERRQVMEASEGLSTINLAPTQLGNKPYDTSRQSISSDLSNNDKQVIPPVSSVDQPRSGSSDPSEDFGQVPVLVRECVKHLEKYGLRTTGIFRVGSSLKRTRQLREDIDSGKDIKLGEEHSPHDVAALLKEFLRDLPEPLLCRDLYNAFLRAPSNKCNNIIGNHFQLNFNHPTAVRNAGSTLKPALSVFVLEIRNRKMQLECMQHLINLLPVANRDTLYTLLSFFAKVVDNSQDMRTKTGELLSGNKMEAYSLATLIAPNILPCLPADGSSGSEEQQAVLTRERRDSIDVVSYLITNYQELFIVSPKILNEVYLDLLDCNPEEVENLIRAKFPASSQELEDLESGIISFRSSQYGDSGDDVEGRGHGQYKRREILVHDVGPSGGARLESRQEIFGYAEDSKESGGCHSGGESDSSSSKSTSRWFRKSRNSDHKNRASSDSGSEKVHTSKSKSKEFIIDGNKRASSLDSVNLKEASRGVVPVTPPPPHTDRLRSSSDQGLKIPTDMTRRQSSPLLESRIINERGERERKNGHGGVIRASLKFTVPLNIDDTDIPFIEEDNSEGHSYHTRRGPGHSSPAEDMNNPFPYEEIEARICLGVPSEYQRRVSSGVGGALTSAPESPITLSKKSKGGPMPRVDSQGSLGSLSESSQGRLLSPNPKPSDPKSLGKETKGANITGLIKSKTADFEKLASKSMGGVFQPSKTKSKSDIKSSREPSTERRESSAVAKQAIGATKTEKDSPSPSPGRLAKIQSDSRVNAIPSAGTVWKRSEIISSPMRKKRGS